MSTLPGIDIKLGKIIPYFCQLLNIEKICAGERHLGDSVIPPPGACKGQCPGNFLPAIKREDIAAVIKVCDGTVLAVEKGEP